MLLFVGCFTSQQHAGVKSQQHAGVTSQQHAGVTSQQHAGVTSQQHAGVSQGRICSDNCTCNLTDTEAADQTFCLTQSQYTDTGPTSLSTDPYNARRLAGQLPRIPIFLVTGMTQGKTKRVRS